MHLEVGAWEGHRVQERKHKVLNCWIKEMLWVAHFIRKRRIPSSNLGPATGYLEVFVVIMSPTQLKGQCVYLILGMTTSLHFLSNSLFTC
jgi:hypothetical protein